MPSTSVSNGSPSPEQLVQHCRRVIDRYPHQVAAFVAGRCGTYFFVTQVMRATLGCADPKLVEATFTRLLR